MKKVFILLLLLMPLVVCAQTLEFSQVKLVSNVETVPAGKVWKVESVIYNIPHTSGGGASSTSSSCGVTTYYNYGIEVNSIPTKAGLGTLPHASSVSYISSATSLPLWLPAGSTLSGGPCNNSISVIEFTVVP